MATAVFGKLPARRDFVTYGAPRGLLAPWETWLQAAMATGMRRLGAAWPAAYLEAPIWRVRLGPAVLGRAACGAIMASMDGVGRHFPLTLLATAEEGRSFPPPSVRADDGWYAAVEELLLQGLEDALDLDAWTGAAERLGAPATTAPPASAVAAGPEVVAGRADGDFSEAFHALTGGRDEDPGCSFLWTSGGAGRPAAVAAARGLPPPGFFIAMICGVDDPEGAAFLSEEVP